jgi:hypothetical protein
MTPDSFLITKRNFFVRALGFTAAGASLSVPIITVADAEARMQHHIDGLRTAMADYYAGAKIKFIDGREELETVLAGKKPAAFIEPRGKTRTSKHAEREDCDARNNPDRRQGCKGPMCRAERLSHGTRQRPPTPAQRKA